MPRFEGNELLALIDRLRGSFYARLDGHMTIDGNVILNGTARRIIGDLSNATHLSRLLIQNVNAAQSVIGVIPGAGSTGAFFMAYAQPDADNASQFYAGTTSAFGYIAVNKTGTGTVLPLIFQTGGSESARITANRAWVLGGSGVPTVVADAVGNLEINGNAGWKGTGRKIVGDMDNATLANRLRFSPSVTNANAFLQVVPDGTGNIGIIRAYGGSDPDNASFVQMNCSVVSGAVFIASNKTGTGTALPMYFTISGSTAMVLSLNRALWIGRTTASVLPDAVGNVEVEGSVSVKTSTVHIASAAPGSPLAGESWQDSTQKALSSRQAGVTQNLVGCIFTGTADATVGNTLTDTSIMPTGVGTKTLPANFWTVGKTVRFTMAGKMSKGTTSVTRKWTFLHGAVTLKSHTTAAGTTALTDDPWWLDCLITCRTIGATGTVYMQARLVHYGVTDANLVGTATVTIDTTAAAALDLKFQWSALDAANTITATNAVLEVLN